MQKAILALVTLLTVVWVAIRRIFKGPLHPGWSYRYEAIAEVLRKANAKGLSLPITTMRRSMFPARVHPTLRESVSHERRTFAGLPAEIFTVTGWTDADPTILYLHGGGYIVCSPATHRDLVSRIAVASGARAIVVDYRKAPEFPFPAPIDDAETAYRALLDAGTPPERLFVAGDSAGGGLALALLQRIKAGSLPMPRAAILLSPWVDLECTGESIAKNARYDYLPVPGLAWSVEQYLGTGDRRHPHVSAVHAELSGLPPLLIQTGSAELFLSENELLAKRAREAGVEVTHEIEPGMIHVFQALATFVPEVDVAIQRIGSFVRAHAVRISRPSLAGGLEIPIASMDSRH
ncbi:MAG TPA: alpha/beta hydrolase [Polyangiaceae bacterium]|jgi:acetyl esterase/lipase|nr:alpha/beta hydrolase [Polyangiaceae bacterium]